MSNINKERATSISFILLTFFILLLAGRLLYLQLWKYNDYEDLSANIRARVIPQIAPRGIIYDRNGKILAESRIIYDLYILPYQFKNPELELNFLRKIGFDITKVADKFYKKTYLPYEPLLVKADLNTVEISYLEENRGILSGIMIGSRIVRNYPYSNTCAHVIGYVGQINNRELEALKNYGYKLGDIIGMSGLERYYDQYLKGINGGQPLEVDPLGNPVRKLLSQNPIPGADIDLTIDIELQQQAEKIFGDNKGALIALSPQTGEVLAMFSKPDYNPNYFTDYLTEKEWQELLAKENPLHNRGLTAYPPGSVFKIITGTAALETQSYNPEHNYFCPGYLYLGRRKFACWVASGHGKLNFFQGFIQSCNVVFYNLGLMLGPDKLAQSATNYGLGFATNIDLPFESSGLIPSSKWKKKIYKEDWYPGDSVNTAIGQGYVLTTPLQMAIAVASLANKNNSVLRPFLARKVTGSDDKVILTKEPEPVSRLPFAPKSIDSIKRLMYDVVQKGTGKNAKVEGFEVCGKTGTAEIPNSAKTHAWFVSFAPYENPELVVVVFVEKGGFGGEIAAGIAKQIYTWWQKNRSTYVRKI